MSIASVSSNVDIANMALQRLGQPTISTLTETTRDATTANQLFAQNRDYCLMLADWSCLIQRATMTRSRKIAITGATAADPVVVSCTGHMLIANEMVDIEDVVGMTQLNDNSYRVFSYTSGTITLYGLDGEKVDGTGFTAWISGGYVYRDPSADWAFVYDLPDDCMKVLHVLTAEGGIAADYEWRKERDFIYSQLEDAGVQYIKQVTDPSVYEADLVEVIVSRLAWFLGMRIHSDKSLRDRTYQEMQAALARAKLTNAAGSRDAGPPEQLWADVR